MSYLILPPAHAYASGVWATDDGEYTFERVLDGKRTYWRAIAQAHLVDTRLSTLPLGTFTTLRDARLAAVKHAHTPVQY